MTDYNQGRRFQGQADVPLNAEGMAQAEAVAARLDGLGISRVISSDLQRAQATARVIADALGASLGLDARLQEVNVGSWSGLTPEEAAAVDPELWRRYRADEDVPHSATGETASAAGGRVAAAIIEHAAAAEDDEVLLLVGHGFTTRIACLQLIGLPQAPANTLAGLGNCHWVVMQPGPDRWRLVAYNRA